MIDKNIIMNLQLFAENEEKKEENNTLDITELQKVMIDMKSEMEKLKEENVKLMQHNQELFLKATSEIKPKENEDSLKEYKDFVGEKFFNSLSNKQQNLLLTILKGDDE